MKKLKFSNKAVASLFLDSQNVEGSIEEQNDGSAILSYAYTDEPAKAETEVEVEVEIEVKLRDCIECVYRNMYNEFSWINERIDRLWKAYYEHTDKHLPNPATPSQMQTAINALGMGEDYQVQKKTIYASAEGKDGKKYSLELE